MSIACPARRDYTNVNEMLQSRVPGIAVNTASGTAGTNRTIRTRGASSIWLSNQPIIFIDGVRFNESTVHIGLNGQLTDRLNDVNPDDIESIEVVKGPAAATLYGARRLGGGDSDHHQKGTCRFQRL